MWMSEKRWPSCTQANLHNMFKQCKNHPVRTVNGTGCQEPDAVVGKISAMPHMYGYGY